MYKIIILDVDGVIVNLSLVANGGSRLFGWMPGLRGIALEIFEWAEIFSGVKYKINDGVKKVCRRDVQVGIITNRSYRGLMTALRGNTDILTGMSFIQVRKSIFGNVKRLGCCPEVWETSSVKPDKSVFRRVAEFAKKKKIMPAEVLLVDDDLKNRITAESQFGFAAAPNISLAPTT